MQVRRGLALVLAAVQFDWFTELVQAAGRTGDVPVVVRPIESAGIAGSLVRFHLTTGLTLRTESGAERRWPIEEVVRITVMAPEKLPRSGEDVVTLVTGDRLSGRCVDSPADTLTIESSEFGRLAIPLDTVEQIVTARAAFPAYQPSVQWFQRGSAGREDRVLLTNGDVLRGFVTSFTGEKLVIDTDGGDAPVPLRLVVAVRMAAVAPPDLSRPHAIVTFASGDRCTFTEIQWTAGNVEGRGFFGETVRFEADWVTRLEVVGGRWEWLSDYEPVSFVHTPMLSLDLPLREDRSVLGGPLAVAGEIYERGIGVHSRTHLLYELKGCFREFVTSFGIDDDSGAWADVAVRIRVDDRTRFEQSNIRRGELYGPVRLDITQAGRIELIVDYGENGDLQDRFNWIEPALIRE